MTRSQPPQISRAMSSDQLFLFLEANGLELVDGRLLAPEGVEIGIARQSGSRTTAVVFNQQYVKGDDVVRAWWPSFRTAWRIRQGDEVAVGPTLGPDEVICDLCNAVVRLRPVPVVNNWALCESCFSDMELPFPGEVEPYVPATGDDGRRHG